MSARMIDKNAAHDVRRNPKEVCAVLPCDAVLVHQSKIRLVDQGSGLQGVVWTFAAQVARRHSVKFVVDGGKKLVQNAFVPLSPLCQQSGHVVGFHSGAPKLWMRCIRRYSLNRPRGRHLNLEVRFQPYRSAPRATATQQKTPPHLVWR